MITRIPTIFLTLLVVASVTIVTPAVTETDSPPVCGNTKRDSESEFGRVLGGVAEIFAKNAHAQFATVAQCPVISEEIMRNLGLHEYDYAWWMDYARRADEYWGDAGREKDEAKRLLLYQKNFYWAQKVALASEQQQTQSAEEQEFLAAEGALTRSQVWRAFTQAAYERETAELNWGVACDDDDHKNLLKRNCRKLHQLYEEASVAVNESARTLLQSPTWRAYEQARRIFMQSGQASAWSRGPYRFVFGYFTPVAHEDVYIALTLSDSDLAERARSAQYLLALQYLELDATFKGGSVETVKNLSRGLDYDFDAGMCWLRKASGNGHKRASVLLTYIEENLLTSGGGG